MSVRTPTQERSRLAARRILDAASQLFGADGYERTTVRAIAEGAKVPYGSMYQYYDGKRGLLDALTKAFLEAVDGVFAPPAEVDQDIDDELVLVVTTITARLIALTAEQPAFRAMFAGPASNGPMNDAGQQLRTRFARHTASALHAVDSDDTARTAADVVTLIVRGLIPSIVDDHGTTNDLLARHLDLALFAYIREIKSADNHREADLTS